MKGYTTTSSVAAFVTPGKSGFSVTCSCGYLVTGWPTQALANDDLDNHWRRCHTPDDDAE